MKKDYIKPEMQAIELKQQGCLLAGSNGEAAKSLSLPGDEKIILDPELDDDEFDV